MKKTLVSLAAASLLVTSAVAADKGIDIVTTGQAVLYYETHSDNGTGDGDLFGHTDKASPGIPNSEIQFGVQLGLDADLGNNFTFGSELQYKGTAGLDKNLAGDRQSITGTRGENTDIASEIALSQMNISKKIGNTTVKVGRQQLPKSLSPFAYTEGWNVFKNSFDAVLVVNTDLPDTTLVFSAVGESNAVAPFNTTSFGNLTAGNKVGYTKFLGDTDSNTTTADPAAGIEGTIYLLTAQNKSIPMTTVTASYYDIKKVAGSVDAGILWGDIAIAGKDLPMGLKVGLQGGTISLDNAGTLKDTSAFGAQVSIKPVDKLTLTAIYTTVDDGAVSITNAGTGVKSPLYSQMVYNQLNIAKDADTVVAKAAYSLGDMGTIIAQYGMTDAGVDNIEGAGDYNEFDLMYKLKAGGVQYFAAWINRSWDNKATTAAGGGDHLLTSTGTDSDNRIRLWARYNF